MNFAPAERLTLARAGAREMKDAGRRGLVVITALVLMAAVGLGSLQAGRAFVWVMAPVMVLLGVVVLFGLLSLWRSARRASTPQHLLVDAAAQVVSGFTVDNTLAKLRVEPLTQLKALSLHVRRGAGTNPRAPKCWATLELTLRDGSRLEGPDAWGPDEEFEATEALLLPVGRALCELSRRPLEVTRLWTGETRTFNP